MLSFFKKQEPIGQLDFVGVDIHSHLLPDLDDGAKDMATAVEMIRAMGQLGYRKLITTPHVYKEYYPNTKRDILEKERELHRALEQAGVKVELQAVAEYYLDDHFDELLERDELLYFGQREKYVLVEASFFGPPSRMEEQIFRMRTKGYSPVLAHPERYMVWMSKRWQLQRLKDMGCFFQLNLLSLVGYYGTEIKKQARHFLKQGIVDFLGTDVHEPSHVAMLKDWIGRKESAVIRMDFLNKEL